MNFDAVSQPDNVGAILLRRAIALSELGSQRADLGNRRAARVDARRQQMLMVQQHLRTEMLRRQAIAEPEQQSEQPQNVGINVDVNVNVANSDDETVIMEENQENQEQEENPWGPQF
jgi:N-methylhydantoinase A/oxoprolinase/acetone carboxylase beta subunit